MVSKTCGFSQPLEQFFLTVGQDNFGNKVPSQIVHFIFAVSHFVIFLSQISPEIEKFSLENLVNSTSTGIQLIMDDIVK